MSKLPKRIQEQLDQANALMSAATQAQADPQPAAQVVEPAPVAPVVAEPVAQAPAPAPEVRPADPEEKWEARYKTLQGMHNKNMEDMKARVRAVEQQNEQLAAQLTAQKNAPVPSANPDPKYAEVFGQDLVEMVQRVAEQMLGTAAKQIDDRMSAIEQKLTGTTKAVVQTAEEMFLTRLKEQVPDYVEVNANPDFLGWLAEIDDVYGVPRQDALTRAADALDAERVAKVFKAFKALRTPAPQPSTEPAAPVRNVQSELERQVAPSTVASNPVPTAQPVRFRVADVTAFYENLRLGKYRGRDQEAAAIEAQINLALAEGRIV